MGELRNRMEEDLTLRGLSPPTRKIYLLYCRKFAAHYHRSPEDLGETEIRQFLLYLIRVQQVSPGTYRQIVAALKFLYTVTLAREWEVSRRPFPRNRRRRLPQVLNNDQLLALFRALRNPKYRAILISCYAAGLRISEACRLRIGAQIGFSAVLHTWGQNLLFHPHLHCVVTGGGLSADGRSWLRTRQDYLFPVRVLSRLFRGKFLAGLQGAFDANQLIFKGSTAPLAQSQEFAALRQQLYRKEWVVYAKAPFAGPEHVYRYLGRYTHRVAISNSRLIKLKAGRVHFHYKDYADDCRQKVMKLDVQEFVRRFLLHVLPKRFVRIRHYGLLAGRNVSTRLEVSRQMLASEDNCADDAAQDTAIWQNLLDHWLEGPSLTYPAGTTVTGAGLSPAGITHLCTAHVDHHTRFVFLLCYC